jgi:predicted Fe-Mo cluster-binding NifX family protein
MNIAVSAVRPCVDAPLTERLEKSRFLVVADERGNVGLPIRVHRRALRSAPGDRIAQLLIDRGVGVVLTGHCERATRDDLDRKGIQVITGCSGSVREELGRFFGDLRWPATGEPALGPATEKESVGADVEMRVIIGGGMRASRRRRRQMIDLKHTRSLSWRLSGLWGI